MSNLHQPLAHNSERMCILYISPVLIKEKLHQRGRIPLADIPNKLQMQGDMYSEEKTKI